MEFLQQSVNEIDLREIAGFPKHKVSLDGKIWSFQVDMNGKVMSPYKDSDGYLIIRMRFDGKRCVKKIHRLVAQAFIPNPENKPQVNHKDGNKLNNHANNLEWVTNKENSVHAWNNGLYIARKGRQCKSSKLTEPKVRRMRLMKEINPNVPYSVFAKLFNVTCGTARCAIIKETWKHV